MEYLDIASETRKSRDSRRSPSRNRSTSRGPSPSRHRARSHSQSGTSLRSTSGLGSAKYRKSRASYTGGNSSSYYRRSPRSNYLARSLKKLRRLLRDMFYYMKRHPYQVFMLVMVPLILSGALAELLAKFGIRLPAGLERAFRYLFGSTEKVWGERRSTNSGSWYKTASKIIGGLGSVGSALGVIKMLK